jgi:O-antigen ligase
MAVVAVVDLPRRITVGPGTSYAWITVGLALLLVLVSISRYVLSAVRGTGFVLIPLYAFAAWSLFSMFLFRPSFAGLQNTLVYAAFAALVPVTAAAVIQGDLLLPFARRLITYSIVIASVLELGNLATGGVGGGDLIGSRSYALVGVIGVAWGVAHARLGGDRRMALLAAVCWLLILLSLSRLAFAASLLIIVVGFIDVRTPARIFRSALIVGCIAAVTFFSVTSFGPLASRFRPEGDLQTVGGVTLNVEGRTNLWGITWRSYLESPVIGQGAGSSETVITEELGRPSHPHNDYLRVLHDFGIIGLVLLLLSFWSLMSHAVRATRAARKDDPIAPVHLAAALALLGLLAAMVTDNALVYLFVVSPVAVIFGVSIGSVHKKSSGDARSHTIADGAS